MSSPTEPPSLPSRPAPSSGSSARRRTQLTRRIRWLIAATISYNLVEAVIGLTAGARASSTALIGFGLDSVIEVGSAAVLAWQFTSRDPGKRETTTLRIIAASFFALAAYLAVDSFHSLRNANGTHHSMIGIALAAASLIVMPALSRTQRRAGRELGSAAAVAESNQALLCTYLSAALLVGLLLNATLGWSWADPIAALVIAAIALNEGVNAWRGDTCCPAPTVQLPTGEPRLDCACCD